VAADLLRPPKPMNAEIRLAGFSSGWKTVGDLDATIAG
jgi:hypothetical protein